MSKQTTVDSSTDKTIDASERKLIIRTFWDEYQGIYGATEGAQIMSKETGIPVNTIRGTQNKMYSKGERPWNLPPKGQVQLETIETLEDAKSDPGNTDKPKDKARQEAKEKRKAEKKALEPTVDAILESAKTSQKGTKRINNCESGKVHKCPYCGASASTDDEIEFLFGFREYKGKQYRQSNCRECRKARSAQRKRNKRIIELAVKYGADNNGEPMTEDQWEEVKGLFRNPLTDDEIELFEDNYLVPC